MDGSIAIAIVMIVAFVIFIAWAKTATGRTTLRNTLGEPHSFRKRQRLAKRRTAPTSRQAKTPRPTKRSPR